MKETMLERQTRLDLEARARVAADDEADWEEAREVMRKVLACGDRQGTEAGYNRHIRAKQPGCRPCKSAHNFYRQKRLKKRKGLL